MFEFEKPRIEIAEISEDNKYGRFVVEPLERGYGTTLGNSLRRIMLSSLPGAAVSAVKIKGVLHEFSSIPGVKEDVTEIIMNIKELAKRAGVSSATVSRVLTNSTFGLNKAISLPSLFKYQEKVCRLASFSLSSACERLLNVTWVTSG